jgi:hypothetical protein
MCGFPRFFVGGSSLCGTYQCSIRGAAGRKKLSRAPSTKVKKVKIARDDLSGRLARARVCVLDWAFIFTPAFSLAHSLGAFYDLLLLDKQPSPSFETHSPIVQQQVTQFFFLFALELCRLFGICAARPESATACTDE